MAFTEKIGTLTATSTTQVQLTGDSIIKLGGQQRVLTSPTLLISVSGIGGLDTGAIAARTLYYVYAVYNGTIVGIVASLSSTLPTGFTRYKKVGVFTTDASSLIYESQGLKSEIIPEPSSLVKLDTGNGHGSTNTCIRRFTNVRENWGVDITYSDSATLGGSFLINTDGIYDITYVDSFGSTASPYGISADSATLSTGISTIAVATVLSRSTCNVAQNYDACSYSGFLAAGTIIRAHTGGDINATSQVRVHFSISKQGLFK